MDVCGYISRIKEAMVETDPQNEKKLHLIKNISIKTMAEVFQPHPAWSDLANEDSRLYQFLMTELSDANGLLSVFKLRCLGVLWCTGDNNQKVHELFENILPNLQNEIGSNNDNLKANLFQHIQFATEMVFRLEPQFKNQPRDIPESKVKEVNEHFENEEDGFFEAFLDTIFGSDSLIRQINWENAVLKDYVWLFDTDKIRKKLYNV